MASYKDGVYYENEVRSIVFYDKKKERKRKEDKPASLVNRELIRAEYRLTERDSIDRFFSSNNFKISTLLNDYYDVIEKVRNVFTSLQWISSKIIDPRSLLEDQNVKMQLMAVGLECSGGRLEVEQLLEIAKQENPNLYKNKIINLRKFLISLEGMTFPPTINTEIEQFQKELEMSFKNVA
ncbi:hypothetical protein [Sphingobacterium corticibacter]|uniref:Uncharacterized protein n=1 Tax=Sphingobacterium corticibacter TaxID=2171749 RepID=A0A2T8HK02_9SPHI|nr:hypothetical protein [Sphingobacterium corticibacter]PVH25774.1 hypothetical protein DC487_07520 [Sphingobacterium corticibacter]